MLYVLQRQLATLCNKRLWMLVYKVTSFVPKEVLPGSKMLAAQLNFIFIQTSLKLIMEASKIKDGLVKFIKAEFLGLIRTLMTRKENSKNMVLSGLYICWLLTATLPTTGCVYYVLKCNSVCQYCVTSLKFVLY